MTADDDAERSDAVGARPHNWVGTRPHKREVPPPDGGGERRLSTDRLMPVPEGLAGMRVDAGLARLLGLSRSAAAAIAEDGGVVVDGVQAAKSDRLKSGAWLQVRLPESPAPLENTPVEIEGMTILYSDDDIVAVDKPAAVAAHASVGWTGTTVLGGLAAAGYRITTSGVHERQGIVHRLDVGTSGVMVVAISERAYTALKRAFKHRLVDKRYHALVQGHPDPSSGTIDAPIGRHPGHEWKFAVTRKGRHSITHYDTLEAFVAASLLDVQLETGRTHQIRVHFAALRHPCCGDLVYGADPKLANRLGLEHQWLHARSLAFAHPADGRRVEIVSPYPPDLRHALDVLRAEG
ncbi:putative RNA pseudouridine synthase [Mycobacterium shinjukuense]|uniref:Pseudouridine synthase n=2 Tax=Mycobacterium shinjukuense TaxID=398694 RepID=A0A7I7MPN5_9MYCO|nr:putative RNA pseudouridine synthase [Mycobacterium shinjukuense]